MSSRDPLTDFAASPFGHAGETRTVYRQGAGPAVLVVHEAPGITPQVAAFARRVVSEGFTVFMPHLFGVDGQPISPRYVARSLARACISAEFACFAGRRSSPVTDWLRALCRHAHAECGGPGVGAIGMCLTGNFALSMMVDPSVMAPVLSQPSLPIAGGSSELGVSPAELAVIKRRVAEGVGVLGLRFSWDALCPAARFRRLERELGDGFEGIEVDSSPSNPWGISVSAHSVVTTDLVDEVGHPTRDALERVLALFHERLRPDGPS